MGNPLAAIRGAAQWLVEDSRRARHGEEHRALLELVIAQTDRLDRVLRVYARLAQTSIVLSSAELVALSQSVERE
jgi:nitrogen-specific signal transduction histidine kinase